MEKEGDGSVTSSECHHQLCLESPFDGPPTANVKEAVPWKFGGEP